jgi:hypothetical protein
MTTEVTAISLLLGALGVLATVITHLWNRLAKIQQHTDQQLADCEKQHVEANDKILTLTTEFAELRGRDKGITELAKAIVERFEEKK